jgi:hypothetical protein
MHLSSDSIVKSVHVPEATYDSSSQVIDPQIKNSRNQTVDPNIVGKLAANRQIKQSISEFVTRW